MLEGKTFTELLSFIKDTEKINEIGPTLPINIINIIKIFDKVERALVIPAVNPTVANADTVSNVISKTVIFFEDSATAIIAVTIATKKKANIVRENAL